MITFLLFLVLILFVVVIIQTTYIIKINKTLVYLMDKHWPEKPQAADFIEPNKFEIALNEFRKKSGKHNKLYWQHKSFPTRCPGPG